LPGAGGAPAPESPALPATEAALVPEPPAAAAPAVAPNGMEPAAILVCVFLPYALGHFLSSLLRNVNAVLAPQFMQALHLTPAQLGMLTSAFFFAFALAQLPVGLALDRYGPRKVQASLLLLAASGVVMFAFGRTFGMLVAARFLVGLGLGGSFMAGVKALSAVVTPARLPSVNGYLIAVGGIGAAASTMPVRMVVDHIGWRWMFLALAVGVLATALLVWVLAPRSEKRDARMDGSSLLAVYRHPAFRRTISLVLVPHAVFFGIQGMWIGRWLSDVAHFSEGAVAYLLYLSMASVIFGAIAVGMITEHAGKRGIKPLNVAAAGIALFLLVQLAIVADYPPVYQSLSVLFTLVGTITGIEYALVAQSMPKELTGRAATCLNLLIFVLAFLVQAGFGLVLSLWPADAHGHYPAIAYRVAFAVLISVQLPGLVKCALQFKHARKAHHETAPLRPAG
ncbi:MFS transporter, partial [Zemynaea arenosa]